MQALKPLPPYSGRICCESPLEPETFICDSIYYYQITGDKDGFNNMLSREINDKLHAYYCGMLGLFFAPLFDINYGRTYSLFDRIFETYDLLMGHMSS